MIDTGFIHGRFQVVHLDHVVYLLAGKERCRHLIVGITNPDPVLTAEDSADPDRSLPGSNPLTYFERYVMVRDVLREAGIDLESFSIVPFPINFPRLYSCYVPAEATFFVTIYDEWGRRKQARFQELGLRVELLWERTPGEKGISAADVRARMAQGADWEHLVPGATARLMKAWNIPGRLRRLGS
ncbi:MAG: nicotinate-nucleotide adenylyltransferase [Deltaproteobacteria bacterium]|nr:nicotinate-nucleotide adenylyltransferase [Deltaproteobacteria bacterium]